MSNCKYRDRFLSCAVLCGLLFFTYRQETVLPEGAVQTGQTEETEQTEQSEAVEETREAEETAEAVREEKVTDTAGEEEAEEEEKAEETGDNEALELLIEDDGFQECVYDAVDIKKKDSKEEVLRKLERCESLTLEEGSCDISSLEALSLFPNVRQLTIYIDKWDDSVIVDFTPISSLSRLEYLWIRYEKDEKIDLSFLEQMPQLKSLFLYQMPVEDLAILENLPNLVELAVSGNENVKNVKTVGKLTKLRELEMQQCGIKDISFLDGLTELRSINLNGNRITDITPLSGLYKLERVELSENKIKDLSAVSGLHNIIRLEINKNEIHDISPLAQLSRLNQVEIADNQVEDLSPLAGKEELLYAVVYGNPVKSLKPVWEAPLLWYTYECAGDEGQAVIADWLVEHYPEAAEFTCVDFVEGDLNGDGLQDRAFVADSEAFDVYEGKDYAERMPEDRRLFILLQQEDGSWEELKGVPTLDSSTAGGMRGDPYRGIFMQEGYLFVMEGWGSRTGSTQMDTYEYRTGSLNLIREMGVSDDYYRYGYDVVVENERTGTWQRYVIAMDGFRMVRVDLADSEHPTHKWFPDLSICDGGYFIRDMKTETSLTSVEVFDRVCEMLEGEGFLAVRESLPYVGWQKEGYERLVGVPLPDYYYILFETEGEEEWGNLYYEGLIEKEGILCHVVGMSSKTGGDVFWVNDATGEITAKVPLDEKK